MKTNTKKSGKGTKALANLEIVKDDAAKAKAATLITDEDRREASELLKGLRETEAEMKASAKEVAEEVKAGREFLANKRDEQAKVRAELKEQKKQIKAFRKANADALRKVKVNGEVKKAERAAINAKKALAKIEELNAKVAAIKAEYGITDKAIDVVVLPEKKTRKAAATK